MQFNPEADAFLCNVLSRFGLNARLYRLAPLARRLPACLRALQANSLTQASQMLDRDPNKWQVALDALLIGVTSFYRDQTVFDELRQEFLPRLLAPRDRLNVWSVACSDGAELYTIAALLAERGASAGSRLRGSDCRRSALERARAGRYPPEALEALPRELRDRYFVQARRAIAPGAHLRGLPIEWALENALGAPDREEWDLILCRNLVIYLDTQAAEGLWRRLSSALRPGGILVVGKAERPTRGSWARLSPCIYMKT